MSTLTLAAVRERVLVDLESELLRIAIASYRHRAKIAEDFSRTATQRGRYGLARGLLEAAATWTAMADGLAEQQNNTGVQS